MERETQLIVHGHKACNMHVSSAAATLRCHDWPAVVLPLQLRWWQQPRSVATVCGAANADVEAFWVAAGQQPGAVASLCNTSARLANKAVGVGSTVKASLGDHERFSIAEATSAYKSDLCSGHLKVGKRGVALPPESMAAVRGSQRKTGWASANASRLKQRGMLADYSTVCKLQCSALAYCGSSSACPPTT